MLLSVYPSIVGLFIARTMHFSRFLGSPSEVDSLIANLGGITQTLSFMRLLLHPT
jgi:hypothetical protein